jgi:oligopeptide transport system substrate-binding protein
LLALLIISLFPLQPAQAADPVTVRIAMPPIGNLDSVSLPRFDYNARDVVENLFLGLTRYNATTGQIEPALAKDWTVSADGLTWTFNLWGDVQWVRFNPDSQKVEAVRPVVAGDFVYGIRRACDPTPPNPVTHTVYIIGGCLKIATLSPLLINDVLIARELGVEAVNDHTLAIKLTFPAPYFVVLAALPEFRPVPREALAKDSDWTKPGVLISNGPWVMTDWMHDQHMTLIRNPLWPSTFTGNVERVDITFAQSNSAAAQQFLSDKADFVRLDTATLPTVKQAKPDAILSTPDAGVTVLGFSLERPIVNNENFRRALALAVDRDALVKQIAGDTAIATSRFTPPGLIGGPTDTPDNQGFVPDKAKVALVASGINACTLTQKLDLAVEDTPQAIALAQALVSQWQAVLGCRPNSFNIRKAPAATLQAVAHAAITAVDNNNRETPRPLLWIASWTGDYPDANAWTGDGVHCQYGYLRTGIACGEADKAVDAAALETVLAKRAELYNKAETVWFGANGTFPVVPLYMPLNAVGRQPTLNGVTASGPARYDLWTVNR